MNHYKTKRNGTFKSEILNKDYFVSAEGITNPFAEFSAFKNLILSYLKNGNNEKTLCKFPARVTLFAKYYRRFNEADRPICADYIKQNKPNLITSFSLLFVSGYFSNPASSYGHTVLKFNYGADVPNQISLNSSVNYGAIITDSVLNPLFIIKGLLGGYRAEYTRNNHFLYAHNYTNNQLRDMWEYKLNLTQQQIKFISEFVWEQKRAKFKYYFFGDNCAHRISKILELATGANLSQSHGFWLLPMQAVRSLGKENKKNPDFIKQEEYHPSLRSTFFDKFESLSKKEKNNFVKFFGLSYQRRMAVVKKLNTKILVLILDYLDMQVAEGTSKDKDEKLMVELETKRSMVLKELWHYPAKSIYEFKKNEKKSASPLTSQPASVVRMGYGIRGNTSFVKTNYRASNNDLLNPPGPGQEISKFILGEVETEITDKSVRLTKATVIDIVSFNTSPLPMRIAKKLSGSLKIGYSRRSLVCSKCSTFGVEAKGGVASRINSKAMLYGLIGGRIHNKRGNRRGIITVISEAGAFINMTKKTILGLSAGYYNDFILGNTEYFLKINAGFNISRNFDLRARLESDGEKVVSILSAGYYFD